MLLYNVFADFDFEDFDPLAAYFRQMPLYADQHLWMSNLRSEYIAQFLNEGHIAWRKMPESAAKMGNNLPKPNRQ